MTARPSSPRRPRQGPAENGALAASTASQAAMVGSGRCVDVGASSEHHDGPTDAILAAMSERKFQQHVVGALKQRGFMVFVFPEMRLTRAGWPDLTFMHPRAWGRVWFWELKKEGGRVRPEQIDVLAMLARLPGADARIVRPGDWCWLRDKLDYEKTGQWPLRAPQRAAANEQGEGGTEA